MQDSSISSSKPLNMDSELQGWEVLSPNGKPTKTEFKEKHLNVESGFHDFYRRVNPDDENVNQLVLSNLKEIGRLPSGYKMSYSNEGKIAIDQRWTITRAVAGKVSPDSADDIKNLAVFIIFLKNHLNNSPLNLEELHKYEILLVKAQSKLENLKKEYISLEKDINLQILNISTANLEAIGKELKNKKEGFKELNFDSAMNTLVTIIKESPKEGHSKILQLSKYIHKFGDFTKLAESFKETSDLTGDLKNLILQFGLILNKLSLAPKDKDVLLADFIIQSSLANWEDLSGDELNVISNFMDKSNALIEVLGSLEKDVAITPADRFLAVNEAIKKNGLLTEALKVNDHLRNGKGKDKDFAAADLTEQFSWSNMAYSLIGGVAYQGMTSVGINPQLVKLAGRGISRVAGTYLPALELPDAFNQILKGMKPADEIVDEFLENVDVEDRNLLKEGVKGLYNPQAPDNNPQDPEKS